MWIQKPNDCGKDCQESRTADWNSAKNTKFSKIIAAICYINWIPQSHNARNHHVNTKIKNAAFCYVPQLLLHFPFCALSRHTWKPRPFAPTDSLYTDFSFPVPVSSFRKNKLSTLAMPPLTFLPPTIEVHCIWTPGISPCLQPSENCSYFEVNTKFGNPIGKD